MAPPRHSRRPRVPGSGEEQAGLEEEEEQPEDPGTSIDDLANEADAETFDQTFTDQDVKLSLQGDFDAVAGSKQVIPRIAYTVNFQMVWNPDRQRWEPDEGNRGTLRAILDGGTTETEDPVELDFGTDLDVTTSGSDPTIATVDSAAGGGGGVKEIVDRTDNINATTTTFVSTGLSDITLQIFPVVSFDSDPGVTVDNIGSTVPTSSTAGTVSYALTFTQGSWFIRVSNQLNTDIDIRYQILEVQV